MFESHLLARRGGAAYVARLLLGSRRPIKVVTLLIPVAKDVLYLFTVELGLLQVEDLGLGLAVAPIQYRL